jgi:methyl-accepting chemotaxis protein
MKLSTRVLLGYGSILSLMVGLAVVSSAKVDRISTDLQTINAINSVKQRYAINFRGSVHDRAILMRDVLLLNDKADLQATFDGIEQRVTAYASSAVELDKMMAADTGVTQDERDILASIKQTEARTMPLMAEVIRLQLAGQQAPALDLLRSDARPAFVEWLARINKFIDLEEQKNQVVGRTVQDAANGFGIFMLLLCGGALGVGLVIGGWTFFSIRPLRSLAETVRRLAANDLTAEVAGADRRDEIGAIASAVLVFRDTAVAKKATDADKAVADETLEMVVETLGTALSQLSKRELTYRITAVFPGGFAVLKDNYNDALESMRSTVMQVSESAQTINTGTAEIAQASEDLARRTESNAASLEETSAALTQMETRLKATATASQSTVARADQAMAIVESGRSTAESAMQAMGRVSGSAKGIDDVIEGLDKIAFQTRVLAMNAAVEAGRAGDAGRGFAVVADLVSALAMRAEEEAKRARDQLSVTQNEIVTAVDAVGKVDTALSAISSDVAEVNRLLGGMASDNVDQSTAITEITAAVSTMDRSTQQNAAMVEQTSAAARNLTQEVCTLIDLTTQFSSERRVHDMAVAVNRRVTASHAAAPASSPPAVLQRPATKLKMVAGGHAGGKATDGGWSDF